MSWKRRLAEAILPDRIARSLEPSLRREILGLESLRSDWMLDELREFDELKSSAWRGLASLGYEVVRHYKPKVVVELGTHMGMSALAIGLAMRDLGEGGKIYAVDTWQGDEQTSRYDDSVYTTFLDRCQRLKLDGVIVPLRMTFDEARGHVPTLIDVLHIDGLHTWEAVTHDWETFGPLVRPGGLVLFHDVNTFYKDMKMFWKMLARRYEHYLVPYSQGLGVIRV